MHAKLIPHISAFTYAPSRPKVSGLMWDGHGQGALDGHTFYINLWWHGPDEDPGQDTILAKGATIEGWRLPDGTYFDMAWHGYVNDDGVWLHTEAKLSALGNHRFTQPPSDALYRAGYKLVLAF